MRVREIQQPPLVMGSLGVLLLGALGTTVLYDSDEHKLLADRGASLVNQRSARLPGLTRFEVVPADQVVLAYKEAKDLAVGFASNNQSEYSASKKGVQDNSYFYDYGQREYNLRLWVPSDVSTRTLKVEGWTNAPHVFTFGELVSLYGDYRRTVYCGQGRCYLTNSDAPQYRFSGARNAGTTYFEYGDDCNPPGSSIDCGWEPAPRLTGNYLRYIGSGLVPPFRWAGNFWGGRTAWDEEELDAGWWGDEMIRIAATNDWHFSSAAIAWYIGMHRLALRYVELARTDNRYWNDALHYEANALHSLTDVFAFGHIVTNRDSTSNEIMLDQGVAGDPVYSWMKNVMEMGGGRRRPDGVVELFPTFPPITENIRPGRSDFVPIDIDGLSDPILAGDAYDEKGLHDNYNASGATVMNLKRQEFTIYGDAAIDGQNGLREQIIAEAVRVSLQSLFDAYESTASIEEIGGVGSKYFDALLSVPVYVKFDPRGRFNNRWTRYAKMVDAVVNAYMVPANACEMEYVNANHAEPDLNQPGCDFAPWPSGARVLEALLSSNAGLLARVDRENLDSLGNRNAGYDVGDFLRWVRATGATPSTISGVPAVVPPAGNR